MADEQPISEPNVQPKTPILKQTLGEILQNNAQAQGMIMQSMRITPEQFQQLLQHAGNNQMMHMTIGDLFKSGIMQQAIQMKPGQKLTSEQMQSIQKLTGQPSPEIISAQPIQEQKLSFMQKLKNLFK